MRKARPNTYNPAQVLTLISTDKTGAPLHCPACGADNFQRDPDISPPPPRAHVTLRCTQCDRVARYIVGAA